MKFELLGCFLVFTLEHRSTYRLMTATVRMSHVQRHEKVSCHLAERFSRWQESWKRENVASEMEAGFNDWLHGRVEGQKPGLATVSNVADNKARPPYRPYTKYNVIQCGY